MVIDISADKECLSIQLKNKNIVSSIDDTSSSVISKNIKNVSIITKSAKSKKLNFIKCKNSDLIKAKKLDFTKINYSRSDFLTFRTKKTFIHL